MHNWGFVKYGIEVKAGIRAGRIMEFILNICGDEVSG